MQFIEPRLLVKEKNLLYYPNNPCKRAIEKAETG